jgi:hypothetical protein
MTISMNNFTDEQLAAYLDETLSDAEMSRIEQELRHSAELRQRLAVIFEKRDRGEHTLGAIWRRERISCPTREQLGGFLAEALEPEMASYIEFHLNIIVCPICVANFDDLKTQMAEASPTREARRQRIFKSGIDELPPNDGHPKK